MFWLLILEMIIQQLVSFNFPSCIRSLCIKRIVLCVLTFVVLTQLKLQWTVLPYSLLLVGGKWEVGCICPWIHLNLRWKFKKHLEGGREEGLYLGGIGNWKFGNCLNSEKHSFSLNIRKCWCLGFKDTSDITLSSWVGCLLAVAPRRRGRLK